MRKLINVRLVNFFACSLFFFGCTDLEFTNEDSIVPEGTGDASELLAAAYGTLSEFANERTIFGLSGHSSDEMLGPTRGSDWFDGGVFQQMHLHTWIPENPFIITSWSELNRGIFRATEAIAGTGSTPQIQAEAKVLRAFFMFHVVDFWGKATFRESGQGIDAFPQVLSGAEAIAFIINDLEEALNDLPDTSVSSLANKSTANAMLAKAYLNKAVYESEDRASGNFNFSAADMNKVIEHANAVIDAGYSITPGVVGYFNTFAEQNEAQSTELIFSIPKDQLIDFKRRFWNSTHYNHDHGGWNGFATLSDFYDSFDENDVRRGGEYNSATNPFTTTTGTNVGFLIGQQFNASGDALETRNGTPLDYSRDVTVAVNTEEKGIRVLKYVPDFTDGTNLVDNPNNSYVLLRYGDVLMNKAEAIFRGGTDPNGDSALDVINNLRTTRSPDLDALTSLDESVLLAERGRELYWEGWRRNDQIRFGTFLGAWQLKEASPAERIVFPFPPSAVLSNPDLDQNPGY